MGLTKTDYMRGMQCPKMLWLDYHKPERKEIPPEIQDRLNRGNDYGDSLIGMFGPFTEVQEYYPGTKHQLFSIQVVMGLLFCPFRMISG